MQRLRGSFVSRLLPPTFIATVLAVLMLAQCRHYGTTTYPDPYGPRTVSPQVLVRGYVAVGIPTEVRLVRFTAAPEPRMRDIYLPGLRVFLQSLADQSKSAVGITDLSGRFTLPARADHRYRLCWESKSFGDGCHKEAFTTGSTPTFLSKVRISTKMTQKRSMVYGRVSFADGTRPRKLEPMSNVNSFAQVELLDSREQLLDTAYVNDFGEYVLPSVPGSENIILRAKIEGLRSDQLIRKEANLAGSAFQPIDLMLMNSTPRLDPVVPLDASGIRVKTAAPGNTVTLRASALDRDGDAVKYSWTVLPGSGTLNATAGDQVQWTLPAAEGLYDVVLVAYDGKGGYARDTLTLQTENRGLVPFSGFVRGTDVPAIGGAEVDLNGQRTVTDAKGWFEIRVPDARRFVLNIRKPGYAFYSKIYDNSVIGGRWTLTRATVATADPTREIFVVNDRRQDDCPGPESSRVNWAAFPGARKVIWQDGKGNEVAPPPPQKSCDLPPVPSETQPDRRCGPGARVRIPANALIDSNGNAPAGNVDVTLSTVDLRSPEQMPGDYTVRLPDGTTSVMESWGAAIVDITAGSRRFNLRSGVEAEVIIPVDPGQLAAGGPLPPTIPLLFYNERDGVWVEEGTASLVGTNYVARVRHFSAINTDRVKTNQSCVRVLSPSLAATYNMEITIPGGSGAAPIVLLRLINNASPSEHVIYNLPSNVNIVVVPIDIPTNVPIGTFVVNTGPPQNPTSPNLPAGPPYVACSAILTLTNGTYPDESTLPTSSHEFLKGLSTFEATNIDNLNPSNPAQNALKTALDDATTAYYNQIDPLNLRPTLNDFIAVNGLGGASEFRGAFANSGDLGFGRDMHCAANGANVACYVTNYGKITTPDSDDANHAANQTAAEVVATVAMEFSPIETQLGDPPDPEQVVKFYVYNAIGTAKLNAADLDGRGFRPIPQLCMVCHNGAYPGGAVVGAAPPFNNRADVKLQSRFLPFDLRYYTFPTVAGFDKASQQAAFKNLNEQIVNAGNAGVSTTEIITKWYAGGTAQDEDIVATGWNDQPIKQAMYRNVVARTCRTCHTAQIFAPLQFKQHTEMESRLGQAESRVCNEHVMPHALATHRIFWNSVGPHMPAQFQVYGDTFGTLANGWQGNQCGVYTPITPPGFYAANIQPIFNSYCTSCHVGSSPPQGLSLAGGVSYSQIVNVAATELPSMLRITPSSPGNSYLLHKINGTQATLPGAFVPPGPGGQMPLFGCCVSAGEVTTLTNWINTGAPP